MSAERAASDRPRTRENAGARREPRGEGTPERPWSPRWVRLATRGAAASPPADAEPFEREAALAAAAGCRPRLRELPAVRRRELDGKPPAPRQGPALLVDDDAEPGPGQLRKGDFLAEVRAQVCRGVEEVLTPTGRTADDCPYLGVIFAYYGAQGAGDLETALRHYVPEAAGETSVRGYVVSIAGRARTAAAHWVATGEITGVPEGAPDFLAAGAARAAATSGPRVQRRSDGTGDPGPADPHRVRTRLGPGRPLDGATRSRMEAAFSADFSRVRTHDDPAAGGLARELRARAFAVGEHVAFGDGQYRPGTIAGDALIAHELAHVVQQGGAPGLRLRRCGLFGGAEEERRPAETREPEPPPEPEPPREAPRDALARHLRGVLADNRVEPAEWQSTRRRAQELGQSAMDVSSVLSFEFDFERPHEDVFAEIASRDNPHFAHLRSTYTTAVSAPPRRLATDPLPALVTRALEGSDLSRDDLEALQSYYFATEPDRIRAELARQNVGDPPLTEIMQIVTSGSLLRALAVRPGALPIRLRAEREGGALTSPTDLRRLIVQALIEDGTWSHSELQHLRSFLRGRSRDDASAFLQGAGIEPNSAGVLAGELTRTDDSYRRWVEQRTLLAISFQEVDGRWTLTADSRTNLGLPWHPTPTSPLGPFGGTTGNLTPFGEAVAREIDSFSFASGRRERAVEISTRFRGHRFQLVIAEALEQDSTLLDRVEAALSVIPTHHASAISRLVLDPGNDPGGEAIADASRTGVVNIYFSGAGPRVPQANLNATTAHEFGHLVSFQAEGRAPDFWPRWERAMADDRIAVSRYGMTNRLEDFAEAYVLFLSGGGGDAATRARYGNRFAILDEVFRTP